MECGDVKVNHLIGQGNFAVIYSKVKQGKDDWAFLDIFRLMGGKIVEHRDIQEKTGRKETIWDQFYSENREL